jgi:hypothetical protein
MREKVEGMGFRCEAASLGSYHLHARSNVGRASDKDVEEQDLQLIGKDNEKTTLVLGPIMVTPLHL